MLGLYGMSFSRLKAFYLVFNNSKRFISNNKGKKETEFLVFTSEQQLQIINRLHRCVANNITRIHLNKKRLQSLKLLFEQHSDLKSLEPLLGVNGFGPKVLHRICHSILQDPPDKPADKNDGGQNDDQQTLRLSSSLITPSCISQNSVESVVSIQLGINAISWARLHTANTELDTWDLIDLTESVDKKFDVHSTWDLVMQLRDEIPDGDIYIMENSNWSNIANVKKPMKYHLQEAMVTTAICSVFNQTDHGGKLTPDSTNRLYFLRGYTPYRLFRKIIGSERVSAQDVVENMISGVEDGRHQPVTFTRGTADHYWALSGPQRHIMSQALILVVSFTELVLRRNSIALSEFKKPPSTKKGKVV